MAARIKLGELLVRAGVLDEFKLKAALAEQQKWGGRLGRILVEMNFLTEDLLVRALSKQLGVPRARLDGANIPPDVLARIDPTFCSNNAICPERYIPDRKTLVVAMADPTNVSAVDELRFKTGLRIETSLGGELELSQAIDRIMYGREPVDGIELSGATSAANPLPNPMSAHTPSQVPASTMPSGQLFETFPFNGQKQGQPLPSFPTQPPLGPQQSMPPPLPPPQPSQSVTSMSPAMTPSPSQAPDQGRSAALEMAVALDAAQRKQLKAIRVMLELLIEKGVITRDEYIQLVNKR
jgi:hypothetical protein